MSTNGGAEDTTDPDQIHLSGTESGFPTEFTLTERDISRLADATLWMQLATNPSLLITVIVLGAVALVSSAAVITGFPAPRVVGAAPLVVILIALPFALRIRRQIIESVHRVWEAGVLFTGSMTETAFVLRSSRRGFSFPFETYHKVIRRFGFVVLVKGTGRDRGFLAIPKQLFPTAAIAAANDACIAARTPKPDESSAVTS
jgi:hypothetical protein